MEYLKIINKLAPDLILCAVLLTACASTDEKTITLVPQDNIMLQLDLMSDGYDISDVSGLGYVHPTDETNEIFTLFSEDTIYYVAEGDDEHGTASLIKTDTAGNILLETRTDISTADIKDADINSKKELALVLEDRVVLYSADLTPIGGYFDGNSIITSAAGTGTGQFIITQINGIGEDETDIVLIEDTGKKKDEWSVIDVADNLNVRVFGYGKGFIDMPCILADGVLYQFDMPDNSATQMVNMKETFINPDYDRILFTDNDLYVVGSRGDIFEGGYIDGGVYRIRMSEAFSDRMTIKIAFYNNANEWFDRVITLFNISNPSYYIEKYNYSADEPWSFIGDAAAGEGPDAVVYGIDDAGSLLSSGIFCDIDSVIDIDTTDIIQSVWDSELDSDGQRLFIAPLVNIKAMYGTDTELNAYTSIRTTTEAEDYITRTGASSFVMYDTRQYLMYQLLPQVLSEADSTGDYELISDLIYFCSNMGKDNGYSYDESVSDRFLHGDTAFLNPDIGSYLQYVLLRSYYDDPLIPVGYIGTSAPIYSADIFLSVTDGRDDYEGIEDFIEFMLESDNFISDPVSRLYYLPISATANERNIEWFVDLYSNGQITPQEITFSTPDGSTGGIMLPLLINDMDNRIIDSTDPTLYLEDFYDLIENTNGFLIYDDMLFDMVTEETAPVFMGTRDIDAAVESLSGRIINYVRERN